MSSDDFEIDPLQRKKDDDHLKILAIFHFVLGGFGLFGLAFLLLHGAIMTTVFTQSNAFPSGRQPPIQIFYFLGGFYAFMGCFIVLGMLLNLSSGYFLLKRQRRTFSIVVAALNCLQFPFGTALGVFTFIVLSRLSVIQSYEHSPK